MTLEGIDADLIEPHRLAGCVVDELRAERRQQSRNVPRGITVREALKALRFEVLLVAIAAQNIANGVAFNDDDRARLMVAWALIEAILDEVGV